MILCARSRKNRFHKLSAHLDYMLNARVQIQNKEAQLHAMPLIHTCPQVVVTTHIAPQAGTPAIQNRYGKKKGRKPSEARYPRVSRVPAPW